jgi:hypothetical protein
MAGISTYVFGHEETGLAFETGGANSTGNAKPTTRMVIDHVGNVGIGEGVPGYKLHIKGAPVGNMGCLLNLRNSVATPTNTTFGGIFFNSSPGYDYSIGKSNVNSTTTLSFRNGNTGASLMDITPDGYVGIGTDDPSSALHVKGALSFTTTDGANFIQIDHTGNEAWAFKCASGVGADDYISVGINGGTQAMSWHETGKVGIGTTNPSQFLEINGSDSAHQSFSHFLHDFGTTGGSGISSNTYYSGGYKYRANGFASHIDIANGTLEFKLSSTGSKDGTINWKSRMSIDQSGFMGIGTSSPKKMLHIQESSSDAIVILDSNNTISDKHICFSHHYGTGNQTGGNYWGVGIDDSENKFVIAFDANAQASMAADRLMTIDSSGNVGIGVTPNAKLHLYSGTGGKTLVLENPNNDYAGIEFRANGLLEGRIKGANDGMHFYSDTGATVKTMHLDPSGNVGIGGAPLSGYRLHVLAPGGAHCKMKIQATTPTGQAELDLTSDPAGVSYLNMGDEDNYNIGRIAYHQGDNSMRFTANGDERMRILPTGAIHHEAHKLEGGNYLTMISPVNSMSTPFQGWTVPFGSLALEFTISNGVPNAERPAHHQELLAAMGRPWQHFGYNIKVYRATMPAGREGGYMGPYFSLQYRSNSVYTVAAFTKLLSGNAPTGHYCNGMTTSWSLTGNYGGGGTANYTHPHPYGASAGSACEFLICMPAVVDGYHDLDNVNGWWMHKNLNGSWG